MKLSKLRYSRGSTDRGKATFIPILEVFASLTGDIARNHLCDKCAFLHGDGSDAGKKLAVFVFEGRQITNYEDFRVSGNAEVLAHLDAARPVTWAAKPFPQRRGGDSRSPQDYGGDHSRLSEDHCARLDLGHHRVRVDFHPQ